MAFIDWIFSRKRSAPVSDDAGVQPNAATQLPQLPPPKTRPGARSIMSYLRTAKPSANKLPEEDRKLATSDALQARSSTTTKSTVRDLSASIPDMSASVDAYIRTAITSSYTAVARNPDATFNRDATKLLQQIISRLDVLKDYSTGYSNILSLRSLSETLARELRLYGSCALELVLDKSRLPYKLQPVSTTKLKFYPDKDGLRPVQLIGGDEIDLDVPTFFYVSLDQDLLKAYSDSPMEAAIQAVITSTEFLNDLRKVIKRALHPRLRVKMVEESLRKHVPPEIVGDPEKTQQFIDDCIQAVASMVNGLNPEDALVSLDSTEIDYLTGGNTNLDAEYKVLQGIMDSKVATGVKTMPSILGHGSQSANVASAEALLFVKAAEGAVQKKLNEILSQALTLAARLFGFDVYVEFAYNPVDLRPESELEAFSAMKQSRVLELLSLGMLSDDEACIQLTGNLPPDTFTPLSGTGFRTLGAQPGGNPYSNTSTGPGGGALNQNLKPSSPQQPKSPKKGN